MIIKKGIFPKNSPFYCRRPRLGLGSFHQIPQIWVFMAGTIALGYVDMYVKVSVHVCFALKIAPQRGKGEKREGVQIAKQSTHNL